MYEFKDLFVAHISEPSETTQTFFQKNQSVDSIVQRFRLGKVDHYDTTDESKDFNPSEVKDAKAIRRHVGDITIYETDRLKELHKELNPEPTE